MQLRKTSWMKKRSIIIATTVAYIMLASFTVFEKKIGQQHCYEEGYSVVPIETGYLVSGNYHCPSGSAKTGSYLVLLSEEGDTLWSRRDLSVNGYIRKTSDGNLLFIGGNEASLVYDSIRISKTDTKGNILWSHSFHFPICKNTITDMIETTDGFVAVGFFSSSSCTMPNYDAFVMKINRHGHIVWSKTFAGNRHDQFHGIKQVAKGVLIVSGWSNSFSPNQKAEYLLVKYDSEGNMMQMHHFGDLLKDHYGYGIEVLADEAVVLCGHSENMEVICLNKDWSTKWTKTLQPTCGSSYFKIKRTSDNGLALIGTETINHQCVSVFYKMKITGEVIWKKTWNGIIRDFSETADGKYLLTGFADYLPDMYVVKFDSVRIRILPSETYLENSRDINVATWLQEMGITTEINEKELEEKFPSVKLYPNPAIQSITMQFHNPLKKAYRLEVYDNKGVLVYMQDNITDNEIILFKGNLDNGIYTYKLTGNGNIFCGKLMFK